MAGMSTWKWIAAVAAMSALAACGGSEPAPPPAGNQSGGTTTTTAPAAGAADPAYASLTGDPANGEQLFRQCSVCHAVDAGVNRLGPSLHGVVGREAGAVEGFSYSAANRDSHLVWTEDQLYTYLRDPRGTIPGTTMAFAGMADPQERADLIAYLRGVN